MPWLLDGSNLTGGGDREPLRRAALALARAERVRIVVFFDGEPPPGSAALERLGSVEVRYVAHADSAIVAHLHGKGRGWRVATDDRALALRVRAEGADVVGARAFWDRLASAEAGERRRAEGGVPRGAETLRELAETVEPLPEAPARVRRRSRRRRSS